MFCFSRRELSDKIEGTDRKSENEHMRIVIKKFTELTTEELYQILKLRSDVFIVEQQCPYPDCDDRDRNAHHLFVEKNGHIWGCLRILDKGQEFDEISIGRVAVHYEYRGIGLARHMMKKALFFITNYLDKDVVKIAAQLYLEGFYESLGFKRISDKYLQDGIAHVDMIYFMMDAGEDQSSAEEEPVMEPPTGSLI